MLGRLARELRLLGIDCTYKNEPNAKLILKRAKQEGRLLLTRNTKLKDKESVLFIESENVVDQVQQIVAAFPDLGIKPMSRCLNCNGVLVEREKESIRSEVPFYVYRTQERFYSCSDCGKIYWRGTHYEDMKKRINKYLKK
jgi:uncharacterized protein with PIN domain